MSPRTSLNRLPVLVSGALLALGLGIGAASAATAYASSNVNVRAGAGTGYAVIDVLRRGERVDVDHCRGAWCYVEKRGPDGWVNANYLSSGRGYYDDDFDGGFYIRPPRPPRPYFGWPYYRSQFCWGGNHASFCFRD